MFNKLALLQFYKLEKHTIMKNKELQESRMRGYFTQATKEMILAEGTKSLSVRSIAEKAGYSFATMYNYFKDVNELISYCILDFANECESYINDRVSDKEKGLASIEAKIKAYTEYMVQYPGIFELFFIEKLSISSKSANRVEPAVSLIEKVCQPDVEHCIEQGQMNVEEAVVLMLNLRNNINGGLLLYMNRQYPKSYTSFMANMDKVIGSLLR